MTIPSKAKLIALWQAATGLEREPNVVEIAYFWQDYLEEHKEQIEYQRLKDEVFELALEKGRKL